MYAKLPENAVVIVDGKVYYPDEVKFTHSELSLAVLIGHKPMLENPSIRMTLNGVSYEPISIQIVPHAGKALVLVETAAVKQ